MVRTLKSRRNTQKTRRNVRRGGGFFNRLKSTFTRKSQVAPEQTAAAVSTSRQPPKKSGIQKILTKAYYAPKRYFEGQQHQKQKQRNTRFQGKRQELFDECVERVMWYLKQRSDGWTHAQLLSFLTKPGSMKLTPEEYEAMKQLLLSMPVDQLYSQVFGVEDGFQFDREVDSWEKGIPATSKEMDEKCVGGKNPRYCLLYAGTPYEKMAHGNVGNSLGRFVTNLLSSGRPVNFATNENIGAKHCDGSPTFFIAAGKSRYSIVEEQTDIAPYYIVVKLKSRDNYVANMCLDSMLKLRFVIDCFTQSFSPGSQNKVYFTSPQMGLWLQDTHPELFAASFGTASGWGSEDQTRKPYTWTLISPLERIRMLTLQHWFARKTYLGSDDDESGGEAARQFFLTYPEPAVSLIYSLQENSNAEFNELAAEFEKNQREVLKKNRNKTVGNSVMSLQDYLEFLQKRSQLTTRPRPLTPAFPPINLSQAVPYTVRNEGDEIFRNLSTQAQPKQPNLSTRAGRVSVLGRGRNRPGSGFGRMTYRHARC